MLNNAELTVPLLCLRDPGKRAPRHHGLSEPIPDSPSPAPRWPLWSSLGAPVPAHLFSSICLPQGLPSRARVQDCPPARPGPGPSLSNLVARKQVGQPQRLRVPVSHEPKLLLAGAPDGHLGIAHIAPSPRRAVGAPSLGIPGRGAEARPSGRTVHGRWDSAVCARRPFLPS